MYVYFYCKFIQYHITKKIYLENKKMFWCLKILKIDFINILFSILFNFIPLLLLFDAFAQY